MNQSGSMILALGLGLGFIIVIVFTFLPNKVSPFQSQGGKSNLGLAVGMLFFGLWPVPHDSELG